MTLTLGKTTSAGQELDRCHHHHHYYQVRSWFIGSLPEELPDKPFLHCHHLGQKRPQVQTSLDEQILTLDVDYGEIISVKSCKGIALSMMGLGRSQERARQGKTPTSAHQVFNSPFFPFFNI